MPLPVYVHAADCATKCMEGCTCTPQVFDATQARQARDAHQGDHSRLEIGRPTPPAPRFPEPVPWHRSQARRHSRAISE